MPEKMVLVQRSEQLPFSLVLCILSLDIALPFQVSKACLLTLT